MTTAFVLSGGGSLGAVQVGMLEALAERGVEPDLVIGTSAGAINAAYIAGHGTSLAAVKGLGSVWRGLRRGQVFPMSPLRHVLALAGARPSLCSADGLRRLIAQHLPYKRLEDAAIPIHVVATDLLSGREVLLSEGDAESAVLASAAIPGVLPPVSREGLMLVDGGVADNAALSQAVALGADEVYLLPTGFACSLPRPPASALGVAMQALTLLIEQRLVMEVAQFEGHARLRLLPPLCPLAVSSSDFTQAGTLIDRARRETHKWLEQGLDTSPAPERFLSLHRH
ncbi:MAG TPA: patatin-like phospholipase family protein [Acidimicrobiales bacterium]|nr:patatin-like phospholipase family protein [Acidimicrobiales bacterium]